MKKPYVVCQVYSKTPWVVAWAVERDDDYRLACAPSDRFETMDEAKAECVRRKKDLAKRRKATKTLDVTPTLGRGRE